MKLTNLKLMLLRKKPVLLNVPLEIRYSIYAYFLDFDTGIEVQDWKGRDHQIDFKLFQICRQVRSETLQYLFGRHYWTPLTVPRRADLDNQLLTSTHLPLGLFEQREMENVIARSTLHIEVGEPPLFVEDDQAVTWSDIIAAFCRRIGTSYRRWRSYGPFAAEATYSVLICHSAASQSSIYHFLASLQASGRPLKIRLTSSFYQKPSTIGAILLPLARLRSRKSAFKHKVIGNANPQLAKIISYAVNKQNHDICDWEEHLLALKEEGDKMFRRANYRLALDYYEDGLRVSGQFLMHLKNIDRGEQPPEAEIDKIQTLRIDMIIAFFQTWNIFVDSSCDAAGKLSFDLLETVKVPFNTLKNMFSWTGTSGQQRVTAHYQRAIVYRNLAEFASMYDPDVHSHIISGIYQLTSWDVTPFLMEAANSLLQVWQADITDESAGAVRGLCNDICERYEATWTHWGHRLPRTLSRITGWRAGTWIEGSKSADAWTEIRMRSSDRLYGRLESEVSNRKQLEQLGQELGFPQEQEVDGLCRLLAAGAKRI